MAANAIWAAGHSGDVCPVQPTDFFSHDGKVKLRGRWSSWTGRPKKGDSVHGSNKLLGARMLGYTPEHFFSSGHVIYPLLRPAMEELFEKFKPTFLATAAYRFRNREQFWPISAYDHRLINSDRGRVVKLSPSAHFSKCRCLTASSSKLEARLKQLAEPTIRMACINVLEAVVEKVPDAMRYLSQATGPAARFEEPWQETYRSRGARRSIPGLSRHSLMRIRRRTPSSLIR